MSDHPTQKAMGEREFQNDDLRSPKLASVVEIPNWRHHSNYQDHSLDRVYTFESMLAIPKGTVVHELCRKMSLVSKGSRCNKKRYVSVYKSIKKKEPLLKKKEDSTCLTFSEVEKNVLCNLFTCYPPSDGELAPKTPHRNRNAKTAGG